MISNRFFILFSCFLLLSTQIVFITQSLDEPVSIIYVDDDNIEGPWDGSEEHPFQHINDALESAQKEVSIKVCEGLYHEQLVIEKEVTLEGETSEKTIITHNSSKNLLVIKNTENVTLSNFTITQNNADTKTVGIQIRNSSAIIISQTIIEQHEYGISITNKSKNCIIYDNTIRENHIGFSLFSTHHNLFYANNVENNAIPFILQNTQRNVIKENTILNQKQKPFFTDSYDTIDHNYWGKTVPIFLFPGFQTIPFLDISIRWIKADWHTASDIAELQKNPLAQMKTTKGTMIFELFEQQMPLTCENFIELSTIDFFKGLVFHRVIDDFVIQGGGYDINGTYKESPFGPINLETHPDINHVDGAISMARTNDPNSATSQFFVCDGPQESLDGKYASFGVILVGFDVLRDIAAVETTTKHGFMKDWPVNDIIITEITIENQ
ncbi:MAG: peptidylprolyl isomerase [Thermoplasmatota archaeon]